MKFGVNRPEIDLQKAKHIEHSGGIESNREGSSVANSMNPNA
jgi:hypothetical protein